MKRWRSHEEILIDALVAEEAYRLGIVPINSAVVSLNSDTNRSFDSCTPAEARRSKRKFRKLWRSLARGRSDGGIEEIIRGSDEAFRAGLGEDKPVRHNFVSRKLLVMWELRRRARIVAGKI